MSSTSRRRNGGHRTGGRPFTRLALILALALVVAACGGDDAETTTTAGETTTTAAGTTTTGGATTTVGETTTTGASMEPVDLTLWVNREQYLPLAGFYDSLAADHPNITVNAELVPDDDLFFQLIRMRESGEPLPDVTQLDDYFAVPMLDSGLEEPMNDLVETWEEEDPEGFAAISANAFFTNDAGDVVGITPVATMDVFYYRADWFAEAGVDELPTSWEGILDAARAVKAQRPDSLPLAIPASRGSGVNWLISQLAASGVPFEGSVPDLTTEEGVFVINWLQTAMREDLTSIEAIAWTDDESRGAYIGGRAAMTYDSIRSTNDLGGALIENGVQYGDGWATMAAPLRLRDGDAEIGRHLLGTRTYHVTSTTEHPYEAGLIIRYLMKPERAYEQLEVSNIPLFPDVLASEEFEEAQPYITNEEVDAILNASQRPADSAFFQVVEILEQLVQDAFQNPDEPADSIAERWQAELDALSG